MGVDFLILTLVILFNVMESESESFKVVGPAAPLIVEAGEDVVLPCSIQPNTSAVDLRIEWFKEDVDNTVVHLYDHHIDITEKQTESYRGRTALLKDELQKGNASLKLSAARVSDDGVYRCLIEAKTWYDDITVTVTVAMGTAPVITMESFDNSGGINLVCEAKGWNPEPVVLWLDKEGVHLSAEATETHKDTEGFSVKRRLTVYHGDSNSFYCRLRQEHRMMQTEVIIGSQVFHAWKVAVITLSVTALFFSLLTVILICLIRKVDVTLNPDPADPSVTSPMT